MRFVSEMVAQVVEFPKQALLGVFPRYSLFLQLGFGPDLGPDLVPVVVPARVRNLAVPLTIRRFARSAR